MKTVILVQKIIFCEIREPNFNFKNFKHIEVKKIHPQYKILWEGKLIFVSPGIRPLTPLCGKRKVLT